MGATISIQSVTLQDGRVRLVDRSTNQIVGVASSAGQAARTTEFFR
jgi:hypothetical protein